MRPSICHKAVTKAAGSRPSKWIGSKPQPCKWALKPSRPETVPKAVRCSIRRPLAIIMGRDRKSTRLNSSHVSISYAVFCLKKKKQRVRHDGHHRQVHKREII